MDLNDYADLCHAASVKAGWWKYDEYNELIERNHGEMIALMHSELSEALEAVRKNKNDDHLPDRDGVEVELADCLIRIFDYAGAHALDLEGALREKMAYNATRADHKPENREQPGGKRF